MTTPNNNEYGGSDYNDEDFAPRPSDQPTEVFSSYDQETNQEYFDPNNVYRDGEEDDYVVKYTDFHWDRIPDSEKSGNMVTRVMYDRLYEENAENSETVAVYDKNYDNLRNSFHVLGREYKETAEKLRKAEENEDTARKKNEADRRSLEKDIDDFEAEKEKDKWQKIIPWIVASALLVAVVVVGFLYSGEKNDNDSISSNTGVQEQQISDLNSALESERGAKSDLEKQKEDLQGRVDDLSGQVAEVNKQKSDMEKQIDDRDKQLEDLNSRIDELANVEAETVTRTLPPEVETITEPAGPGETVTTTVTTTAPATE